jgi:hypothetical protein
MENYIKVDGHQSLRRDLSSGAIINIDDSEYLNYMKIKGNRKKDRDEIKKLKDEIYEIKDIINKLIEKMS